MKDFNSGYGDLFIEGFKTKNDKIYVRFKDKTRRQILENTKENRQMLYKKMESQVDRIDSFNLYNICDNANESYEKKKHFLIHAFIATLMVAPISVCFDIPLAISLISIIYALILAKSYIKKTKYTRILNEVEKDEIFLDNKKEFENIDEEELKRVFHPLKPKTQRAMLERAHKHEEIISLNSINLMSKEELLLLKEELEEKPKVLVK